MGGLDYRKLYKLQDRVLSLVFEVENEFYSIRLTDEMFLDNFDSEFQQIIENINKSC